MRHKPNGNTKAHRTHLLDEGLEVLNAHFGLVLSGVDLAEQVVDVVLHGGQLVLHVVVLGLQGGDQLVHHVTHTAEWS